MLRVFFGHHKCASQWITLVIERMCNEMGWKYICAYQNTINKYKGIQDLIDIEKPDFLILPESTHKRTLEIRVEYKGFHIIRDPRDIIVSCYFSHKNSHKITKFIPTQEHKDMLQSLSKKDGMDYEISISKVFIENLFQWNYNYNNILETRFEILTNSSIEEFERIFTFLDILKNDNPTSQFVYQYNRILKRLNINALIYKVENYSSKQLRKTLQDLSFDNLKNENNKNLGNTSSHYRKGVSQDWKNHLTKEQEQKIIEYFPGILQKLDYV
jgi:hypothetical protein